MTDVILDQSIECMGSRQQIRCKHYEKDEKIQNNAKKHGTDSNILRPHYAPLQRLNPCKDAATSRALVNEISFGVILI